MGSCGGGEQAEAGLAALKALLPVLGPFSGSLQGRRAAGQLEGMIRKALQNDGPLEAGEEYALRMVVLLARKGALAHAPALIQALQALVDRQRGVLRLTVETAHPADTGYPIATAFIEDLKRALTGQGGIKELALQVRLVPELIGGYRVRIGSILVDASLRKQLQGLERDLRAPQTAQADGGVSW
jgi:F-type H+-transporting ATPase subunit delta